MPDPPVLRFSPSAWAKLQWFCHRGDTEIGGFGVAPGTDPLEIEEFVTVPQSVTGASVRFDDAGVADFYDQQVDLGRKPHQFSRLWLHTHPGDSPNPSFTDEATFHRVFGGCDWAVMLILAKGGKAYAHLRFNVGPGGDLRIPVEIDYGMDFEASDHQAWQEEYQAHIHAEPGLGLDLSLWAPGPPGWDQTAPELDLTFEDELLARGYGGLDDLALLEEQGEVIP